MEIHRVPSRVKVRGGTPSPQGLVRCHLPCPGGMKEVSEVLFGGDSAKGDIVRTQPFKITRFATVFGASIALLGILGYCLDQVNSIGMTLPTWQLVSVIITGMVMALVAPVVDVVTRAYLHMHTPAIPEEHLLLGTMEVDVKQENGNIELVPHR